jgi:hypothetical protein
MRTLYPVTPEIIEWLNHKLVPIEAAVFKHFRGIIHLIRIVDQVEDGLAPKYAAMSMIRRFNRQNHTNISYEDVRDRTASQIFLPEGDWAAYVDDLRASEAIISGDFDDPLEALENAPDEVQWVVLWIVEKDVIAVYRSPHTFGGELYEDSDVYVDGQSYGTTPAPALPPDLVASMGTQDAREILHPHTRRCRVS